MQVLLASKEAIKKAIAAIVGIEVDTLAFFEDTFIFRCRNEIKTLIGKGKLVVSAAKEVYLDFETEEKDDEG